MNLIVTSKDNRVFEMIEEIKLRESRSNAGKVYATISLSELQVDEEYRAERVMKTTLEITYSETTKSINISEKKDKYIGIDKFFELGFTRTPRPELINILGFRTKENHPKTKYGFTPYLRELEITDILDFEIYRPKELRPIDLSVVPIKKLTDISVGTLVTLNIDKFIDNGCRVSEPIVGKASKEPSITSIEFGFGSNGEEIKFLTIEIDKNQYIRPLNSFEAPFKKLEDFLEGIRRQTQEDYGLDVEIEVD